MTVQTIIIYLLTGCLCYVLARKAAKYEDKCRVMLIVMILSAVSGLRSYSVGIDTQTYARILENIVNGDFMYAYGVEESFKYICYAMMMICKNPTWMFIVLAFVTNGFIVFRLWECREFADFKYSFACYYAVFFFMTMNICRQFAAVAIVFWATRFIFSKEYWKFIAVVLISALIHTSSMVGMLFLAFQIVYWKYLNARQKVFIVCGVMLSPIGIFMLFNGVKHYGDYLLVDKGAIGIMLFIKLFVYALSLLITKRIIVSEPNDKVLMNKKYKLQSVSFYYFIGIIITFLGYLFPYVDRIGLYFYLFEGVHIGKTITFTNSVSNRQCFVFIETIILLYYFISSLVSGAQGVVPYLFIWQS